MRLGGRRKENNVAEAIACVSFGQVLPFRVFAISDDVVHENNVNAGSGVGRQGPSTRKRKNQNWA
jgi:hypothetical protein